MAGLGQRVQGWIATSGVPPKTIAPEESRAHMNMRAGLVDARPSTRSRRIKIDASRVYIPAAELFELLTKIGEETDGQVPGQSA